MKIKFLIVIFCLFCQIGLAQNEVVYHVFQRSFFDSDGDENGDLKGMREKLDYLQDLGVTTILLTPLYVSDFYHNYFADDFENIDPEYGSMKDYIDLVKEVHRRKMKIYQDVEMQYVSGNHPWFKDSFENPKSEYSKFVVYNDAENKKPWYFFDVPEFTTYDNAKHKIIVVNMKEQAVKEYTLKVLKSWVDPNNDGKFDDGVDGFRLDHMMDNLDNANRLTGLFSDFWTPVLTQLKAVNPKLKIVAEQANWNSFGHDYFEKGNVDYVFAFRLKFAINSFEKEKIIKAADSTFNYNPSGKNQFVFLENHDTKRFASEPGMTLEKEKVAAAIQLLIGGIPSIYYGQEIGMNGQQQQFGMTDGNDIPVREAFDWYANGEGKGVAEWYKNTGVWWDKRNSQANDGISFEEQQKDPESLFNFYRSLIKLRKKYTGLHRGSYRNIPNDNPSVLTFERFNARKKIIVSINLSDREQVFETIPNNPAKVVFGGNYLKNLNDGKKAIAPYGVIVVYEGN
ncbi:alpha-amylase family glycosyl hydrolase [Flavobacterium sp. 3HN19-14]|uniref:alpha-amylase family glycosyl hydrolase n=1 Tax=Flavobacterium sp. 3HN19-14 TaxID=3448133 RepID=UPI003EDF662A